MNTPHVLQFAAATATTADGPVRFCGIAYSGNRIPAWDAAVDLSSTTTDETAPLLADHDRKRIIGVVQKFANDGASLKIEGLLHTDLDPVAADFANKSKRGNRLQLSIGLFGAKETRLPAGTSQWVNGKLFEGPMTLLTDGRVREVSVVALGADAATRIDLFGAGSTLPAYESKSPLVRDAEQRAAIAAASRGTWR